MSTLVNTGRLATAPSYQGDLKEDDNLMSAQSLPRGTTGIVGSSATGIRKRLLEAIQLGKGGQYVLVTNVSPDLVEQSIDKRVDVFGCKCQITYDADTRRMIVKLPGGPHEISSGFFDLEIAYQTQLMNLAHALKATRSKTHKDGSYIKEPDSCFRPRVLPPGRSIKWPTLVLECGWAESLRHLRVNADWWISHSKGEVKAVIIASIKKDPYKLHIERYSGVQSQTRERPRYAKALEQTVKVYRASNGIAKTVGHPLIIPFAQVMLRTSNGPPEGDFIFDQANLIEMAIDVWDEPV